MVLRPLIKADYEAVKRIYEEGIRTQLATFETTAPDWESWDDKNLPFCRFVAVLDDQIVGWVALSPVSKREVYRGVAEVSIYTGAAFRGQGIGNKLMNLLIEQSKKEGIWTLQSNIFIENEASLKLHLRNGFRIVGIRERIGQLNNGEWKDNILLEKRFND
jgi:phosphinothricin acetyltransferase